MRISLCMIARDEEKLLPECLESVREEVDEIILVDTGSGDGTPEIARQFGARVWSFRWRNDFAAARNAALDHATGDWIPVGLAHYAWQLSDAGDHLEAAARARLLVERHGESPLLHLVLARASAAAGDLAGAGRHLGCLEAGRIAESYQYFPMDYDLIRRRGRRVAAEICEREGRLGEAERGYRRLVEADPSNLASALRLVCVLVQMGAYGQALDALEAFPALLEQGLPEIDCLGFVLARAPPRPRPAQPARRAPPWVLRPYTLRP